MADDHIAGYLQIGSNEKGEVVMNLPKPQLVDKDGNSYYVFSIKQARSLAYTFLAKAKDAEELIHTSASKPVD